KTNMAQFYNLTSFQQADSPAWSNEYGTFQTFWANFEGIEGGVMINKRAGTQPAVGQVYGDLIQATSAKGNTYWKFKSQTIPAGTPRPATAVTNPVGAPVPDVSGQVPGWFLPFGNMIQYIYNEMKKMDVTVES